MNHFKSVLKTTTRSHGEQVVPEHGTKPCPAAITPSTIVGGVKVSPWANAAAGLHNARRPNIKHVISRLFIL
jgi:hypothetical protein